MLLHWIILLAIAIVAFKSWKRAALIWFPLQFLFNSYVRLFWPSPDVSLRIAGDLVIFICFVIQGGLKRPKEIFIFKTLFVCYLISYGLTLAVSTSVSSVLGGTLRQIFQTFIFLYVYQKAIQTKEDLRLTIKCFIIVGVLISLLGVYEVTFQDNPWLDRVWYATPGNEMFYSPPGEIESGELQMRYGSVRAYSFFSIHIAFGMTCIVFMYLLSFVIKMNVLKNKKIAYICILLLAIGALMSNSKTPIVGLLFLILTFGSWKKVLRPKYIILAGAIICIILYLFPNQILNFYALFDSDLADEGGGSTTEMRQIQFATAFDLFLKRPFFGYGYGYEFSSSERSLILGLESSWMQVGVRSGILGIIVYIYTYIFYFQKLKRLVPLRQNIGFLGGLMAMETVTGVYDLAIPMGVVMILIKTNSINERYKVRRL